MEAIELPGGLPGLGHLGLFIRHAAALNDWIARTCVALDGRPWRVRLPGQPPLVVVSTPAAMEDVCRRQFDNFPKGPGICDTLADLFGHGLLAVDGREWHRQRQRARHLLTPTFLRDAVVPVFHRQLDVLMRILDDHATRQRPVDLQRLFRELTIEALAEVAFGIEMGSLGAPTPHPFHAAMDRVSPLLLTRMQRPAWFWRAQRALGLGVEGELARHLAVVNAIALGVVRRSMEAQPTQQPDNERQQQQPQRNLITCFLDAQTKETADNSSGRDRDNHHVNDVDDDANDAITPELLRDIAIVFLVAGRDTSADTLTWFWSLLDAHPRVEAAIRAELEAMGVRPGRRLTLEETRGLVYLEAALQETLRLYPPAAINTRDAVADTELSDGTFIPAGTRMGLAAYALGRLPGVWGPDAEVFRPERWLEGDGGEKADGRHRRHWRLRQVSPFQFMAFHAGPRMCLGATFGMLAMKLVAARVLSERHLAIVPGQDPTQEIGLTLARKHGLWARVQSIS